MWSGGPVSSLENEHQQLPPRFKLGKAEDPFAPVKSVALVVLFFVSLVATSVLLSRALPPLEVPLIDEKLAFFADHRDEFDTLFFGSSRTYAQIFPKTFDARAAEAGIATKSFNFGADGMFPPEDSFVAEKLFALRPKNLKRVFIEVSFFRDHWFAMDPDSVRALYWHDEPRLRLTFLHSMSGYDFFPPRPANKSLRWKDWRREFQRWWADLGPNQPLGKKLGNVAVNTRLYFRWRFNGGRGSDLVARLGSGKERVYDWWVIGEDWVGMRRPQSRSKVPEPDLSSFDRRLAEVTATPVALTPMQPAQHQDLRRIVDLVRAAGAEPILFVAPDVSPCRQYLPDEPNLSIFDFSEVAKWPQLYRRENRLDSSHLDYAGAQLLTEEFARLFISHERAKAAR